MTTKKALIFSAALLLSSPSWACGHSNSLLIDATIAAVGIIIFICANALPIAGILSSRVAKPTSAAMTSIVSIGCLALGLAISTTGHQFWSLAMGIVLMLVAASIPTLCFLYFSIKALIKVP